MVERPFVLFCRQSRVVAALRDLCQNSACMLGLPSTPWLFGHRGSRDTLAENTIPAMRRAADAGAVGIEIDVRLCASGEVVVAHDVDLKRVTDGRDSRMVAELSLAELQAVVLQPSGTVPSLEQVIEFCSERDLALNIELKSDVPSRFALVRATLALLQGRERVVISSFDPLMLAAVRWWDRKVPIGLLLHEEGPRLPVGLLASALRAASIHVDPPLATEGNIDRWHDAGLRVLVWTVNDPTQARRLIERGVDGIMTDHPRRMRKKLSVFKKG